MLPKSWTLRVVDMDVTRLRDADLRWADYVMIGAMIVHKQSIDEEIIPRMLPDDLDALEYRLINTLYKLSRDAPPVVALVAPKDPLNIPPYMRQLYAQMGRPLPVVSG